MRLARYVQLDTNSVGSNYTYINATAALKWYMTPTWYVSGGVAYVRERFALEATGSADNSEAFVSVGYKGLGRRQ